MKTRAILFGLVFLLALVNTGVQAQPRKNTENKKVAFVKERFAEVLKLNTAQLETIGEIFTTFYNDQEKIRENIQKPPSGMAQGLVGQDFQSVRKRNELIIASRDEKLKKLLTTEQFKTWLDVIEPSLKAKKF